MTLRLKLLHLCCKCAAMRTMRLATLLASLPSVETNHGRLCLALNQMYVVLVAIEFNLPFAAGHCISTDFCSHILYSCGFSF